MFANSRVHWLILRTSIEERLVYRWDFAFATLIRFLPIVTQVFLWGAIYSSTSERTLNDYTYADMVAYYLLAMVARAFSSMPGLPMGIAREIREGTVKKYLTQPIDMLGYLFWHRIAHKLVYYLIAVGPFALVFWLCRDYLPGWPDGWTIAGWIVSLLLAFLIGFLIESLIGLVGFWFLEVSSLIWVYMMISYFVSGHMIPLDWLPAGIEISGVTVPVRDAIDWMPFKYLAYFPAAVILGRFDHAELASELLIAAGWVVVLLIANRVAFSRGVRRYSAFGG
jgi:ABC-2 type transport system permease protein